MEERLETIATPGGRRLAIAVSGPESGPLVVAHGGTPSSGRMFPRLLEDGARRGLRHVSYPRPGYGESDRDAGRSVADCADDVAAIADHLGAERFHTIGWSGGAPHALACAALMPDRVVSAASIAGIAPFDAAGLDWYAGMSEENVEETRMAERGEEALRPWLEREVDRLQGSGPDDLREALGGLLSPVDREALSGDFARFFHAGFIAAVARGVDGWLDDDLAFVRPWGFDLGAIRVPVAVWQGAEDQFVPFAHGRWLADNTAGAEARLLDDHGHLSLSIVHYGDVLDNLVRHRR